jgi:hypothetical protein
MCNFRSSKMSTVRLKLESRPPEVRKFSPTEGHKNKKHKQNALKEVRTWLCTKNSVFAPRKGPRKGCKESSRWLASAASVTTGQCRNPSSHPSRGERNLRVTSSGGCHTFAAYPRLLSLHRCAVHREPVSTTFGAKPSSLTLLSTCVFR